MYENLNYKGDLTSVVRPGMLLGYDEVYNHWEVIDAEYDPEENRTTVRLQYATEETLKRELS